MDYQLIQSPIILESLSDQKEKACFSIKLHKIPRKLYSFILKEMHACSICINAITEIIPCKECCGTWRFLEEINTSPLAFNEVNATLFCQVETTTGNALESAKTQLSAFYEYYYRGLL